MQAMIQYTKHVQTMCFLLPSAHRAATSSCNSLCRTCKYPYCACNAITFENIHLTQTNAYLYTRLAVVNETCQAAFKRYKQQREREALADEMAMTMEVAAFSHSLLKLHRSKYRLD